MDNPLGSFVITGGGVPKWNTRAGLGGPRAGWLLLVVAFQAR